ncbi:glycosyltransferase family 33 protein [Hebeloma cylindrosporum]|uniref:Chitobiosyldiphosphodolichol beta-mannosyltransferase n=1 Tax=Hebeloma cylindrosporum TaxID=76867 RepID=A0A0C3CV24_HEBCY|nr:glycosyltransferase family 33 protein [Hebeloma cylindrosporum h7]
MSEIHFLLFLSFVWLVWFTWKTFRPRNQHSLRSVAILVLGDIGRSPRMMYHAQSFAENGFVTDLIGYGGSKPIPALERLPRVQLRQLPEVPKLLNILPFLILAPVKIVHQVISILLCLLFWIDVPPEFILVQNPPSIPTLALVQLVGRIRGSRVIIDWHNLGYSILSLKLGKNHILVRIAKSFEETFGYSAYAHLFVTRAMRDFLVKEWDLQGHKVVLYDRPPRHFHRCSTQEIHELFCKLQPVLSSQKSLKCFLPDANPPYSTGFTHTSSKSGKPASRLPSPIRHDLPTYSEVQMPTLRPDRTALLVSSTSWTPDEDFTILLEALQIYEGRAREITAKLPMDSASADGNLPKLLVIVTGKGPLREKYMKEVGELQETWRWVKCISLWLEAEDYPILLGSADLGVSLHASSSELDLPMKVVDMFGCGLPVCALDFACLNELVKNGKNGLVFQTASQLALQLEQLLLSYPDAPALHSLTLALAGLPHGPLTPSNPHIPKQYATREQDNWTWSTWEENWGRVVRPLILSDVNL